MDLQTKLEKLEVFVDSLLQEREELRSELHRFEVQMKKSARTPNKAGTTEDDLFDSLDELRRRLSDSEATNLQLAREREQIKEKLVHVRQRLDLIEAKLLEQRSVATR